MIDDFSKAWAAGFFEGEGSIHLTIHTKTHNVTLAVAISQVDKEPLEWLNARWPGKIYHQMGDHGKAKVRRRPYYKWLRLTRKAAQFLADIRPFIVRPRVLERIDLALEFQAQRTYRRDNRTAAYSAMQDVFAARMKELNARGRGPLPKLRMQIDRQLKLFSDEEDIEPEGEA